MSLKQKNIEKILFVDGPVRRELHIEYLPGWGHSVPEAPCPHGKVHAKIKTGKNSASKEPQKQMPMQIKVCPPKEGKVQLREKRCEPSKTTPKQKQENKEGPCPFPSAKVRLQQRRASAAQQGGAASSSGADNEAYVPLDHYPVPDDDAISTSKKKNKKKPRQRMRIRNKAFVDAADEALDTIATMVAEIINRRGLAHSEAVIFRVISDLLFTKNLPGRITHAIALVGSRVNREGIGFIAVAVANNLQASARAKEGAAANERPSEGATAKNLNAGAALSGSAAVNNDSTGGGPENPFAKPKPKPLAAEEAEPVYTLDQVMKKAEHVRRLTENFFTEWGAKNSLDHIQGIQIQSIISELKELAVPPKPTETPTGLDEMMSMPNNFNDLITMVNDLYQAAISEKPLSEKPLTADMCVGTDDFIVGVDAAQMTDEGYDQQALAARGELGAGLPPKTEKASDDDDQTISDGEADVAAAAAAAAALLGGPQISGAGKSIAEQQAAATNAKHMRFLVALRDGLSPNQLKNLQTFLAQGEGRGKEKRKKRSVKYMQRDMDGLEDLLKEAIDYYRNLKVATDKQAKKSLLVAAEKAKKIKGGQSVSQGTNGGLPAKQQAEVPLPPKEEKPNAEQRPGLVGMVPNSPPIMDDLAKEVAAATDVDFEISFFDTTKDDGKLKEWYENGEKVTGKYFPMILGGTFDG